MMHSLLCLIFGTSRTFAEFKHVRKSSNMIIIIKYQFLNLGKYILKKHGFQLMLMLRSTMDL